MSPFFVASKGDACVAPTSSRHQLARAFRQGNAAARFDLVAVLELAEGADRGLDEVLRAGRAVGLREDVGDTGQLEARADALAGGDAGARPRRDEDDRARAAGAL